MTFSTEIPIFIVVTLLLSSYIMPLAAGWRRRLAPYLALAVLLAAFGGSTVICHQVLTSGSFFYRVGGWASPWGIELALNPFNVFMLMIVTGISSLILIYTSVDFEKEVSRRSAAWYYTLYLLLVTAMAGMALTNDLFNLYVFVEVLSISACALVVAKGDSQATEATFRYLMLATIGSGFVLFAIGLLYIITGNLNMSYISMELQKVASHYPHITWVALSFFLVGFGIKGAVFPIHVWLPDAHSSAPSFSSALLSGLVVKAYLFALIKVLYLVFGQEILRSFLIPEVLALLGAGGIIFGSLFALSQWDIKRMLAYSTVAQVGYIALGLGLNNKLGLTAALLHILNHALIKACLFLAAGGIIHRTGKRKLMDLYGLAGVMPTTMAAFTLGSFSLIGIPLLNGFITKLYLIQATIEARRIIYLMVVIASTLLNASYFFPIIRRAYFSSGTIPAAAEGQGPELPLPMLIPIIILAAGILVFGLIPSLPLALVEPAVNLLLGY